MLGRAAMMIRFPGWKPDVIRSRSRKPDGDAGHVRTRFVERCDPLEALLQERLDVAELPGRPLLRKVEHDLLCLVDEFGRLSRSLPAESGDLPARPDQPPEGGSLADDLGVVAGVCARGNESCELVDPRLASDVLELAPLVELVDERDRVDRLALRIERERRAVHLGVALAIELAPSGIEDFAHGCDRPRGEHHRSEDGLLRIEVLRRDRSSVAKGGGHSSHDRRGLDLGVRVHSLLAQGAGKRKHMFAYLPDDVPRSSAAVHG